MRKYSTLDKVYLVKRNTFISPGRLSLSRKLVGKRIKLVAFEVEDKMERYRFKAMFGNNISEGEIMAYNPSEAREKIIATLEKLGKKNFEVRIYEPLEER